MPGLRVKFFCPERQGGYGKILELDAAELPQRDEMVSVFDRDTNMYVRSIHRDFCEDGEVPEQDVTIELRIGLPPHMMRRIA